MNSPCGNSRLLRQQKQCDKAKPSIIARPAASAKPAPKQGTIAASFASALLALYQYPWKPQAFAQSRIGTLEKPSRLRHLSRIPFIFFEEKHV
jgi:hypothetical protein